MNVTAPLMLARAVLLLMVRARRERFVIVTTSLGAMLRQGYMPYGASKAAAEAATAVMSEDLAGTSVTANVLRWYSSASAPGSRPVGTSG